MLTNSQSWPAAQRSMQLIDRYNGLRSQKMDSQAALVEWASYCQVNELDHRHDAGDFFT